MVFEEITTPSQVAGKTDRRTVNVFLILGIIGFLVLLIINLIHTGIYLEYIRLYNLDPTDWMGREPIIALMNTIGSLYFYPAMLTATGFYGIIDRNGGRFGLLLVFVMLWPYSFNLWQVLSILSIYEEAYYIYIGFSVSIALISGLILSTTRQNISRPKLLYLIIILNILQPIVYFILNVFVVGGIASGVLDYLIQYSAGFAVEYSFMILAMVLFFIELRRETWQYSMQ